MAHLNYHGNVIMTFKEVSSNRRYHVTETNWILRTDGPRMGKCKVYAKPSETEKREKFFTNMEIIVGKGHYIKEF